MILLQCGLKRRTRHGQTNTKKPIQSLRYETCMDQRLRAIEGERYLGSGLSCGLRSTGHPLLPDGECVSHLLRTGDSGSNLDAGLSRL